MADSTLSNLTSLTLPSQATDLLLVGRGTARPNKVAMSDALNSAALAATTGAYGVVQLAASGGTTAGTVVQATDARLSDTRNPPDGSKGDIVVSGSGSTWTIKTNPTLSGTVSADILRVGDGTAAAPSLSFTNDSDTGFYKVAAATDIVYFAAGGQPSLRLVSGGYLYSGTINSYLLMAGTGAISLVADVTTNQNVSLSASGTGAVVLNATNILFRSQTGGIQWAQFNNVGTLTLGTGTDSGNGRIQLVTHSSITGGIGFGTDVSLFRAGAGILDIRSASTPGTTARLDLNGTTTAGIGFRQTGSRDWFINAEAFELRVSCLTAGSIFAVNNGTPMAVRDTTASTATNSGALVVTGGVGIGGVINAGSGTHTFGNAAATGQLRVQRITTNPSSVTLNALVSFPNIDFGSEGGGYTFGAIRANDTEILRIYNANLAQITNVSGGGVAIGGGLRVSAQTASTSTITGAAVISGGVGIAGDTYVGGIVNSDSNLIAARAVIGRGDVGSPGSIGLVSVLDVTGGASRLQSYNFTTSAVGALNIQPNGGALGIGSTSTVTTINGTTVSSSTTSGALVVSGGVGIAGNTYIGGNLVVTGTISPSSGAGLTNVWIPASQWIPRTTNGCGVDSTETTTNRQNFDELLFDPAAIEYAQALVRMPSNYNNGTVTARFFWSASSSTGSVVWALQARAFADDDALDTAFGTAQTVTDTLLATGDMHISAATSAVTSGGTPAATTPLQFQIYRDATNGSDTLGSDARLLGVEISYTSA